MELYQIRYFLAVAETLNFTRASERSFISQPALTKAIQRLEVTVGGRLFDRAKNPVQLTELGRVMLPNFRQIYDSATQTRELARRFTREHKEVVRVGVMCTIDFELLLPGFGRIHDGPGAIELRFSEGSFESLTHALDQGDIDLGIMCSAFEIPKRFKGTTLFSEDYVVALGSNHRFYGRSHIEMAELHQEQYCERVLCEFSTYIGHLLDERGIVLDTVHQSQREDWIETFVRADFGVAFMPLSIARAANLAYVLPSDCPIVRCVGVFVQAERPVSTNQQLVVDALAAHDWGRAPVATPS